MAAGDPGSPARYYSSTAVETALSGSIPSQSQGQANTSFIVASVSGFPTDYPYTLIVDPDTSKEEVVTVYAGAGTTLSVYRGSDNTQGVAHSAGAVVRHGVSGREFREEQTHIAARGYDIDQAILSLANQTHVHGIQTGDGVVVGTDKIQTLTRKTLTSPTITNPNISGAGVDANIVFEGATADAHETTLTVAEPTQDNTITLPNTTGIVVLHTAVQTLSNKTLGSVLDAGGYKITNLATPTLDSDAVRKDFADAQVAAAATSAASAAASATAAATSATSAAASATSAAASVATIAGFATASANSASAAATSATSAAASATASASSASASATSASAAATSAASAATSATAAATSAASAATSATNSAASATAAATSATSAANSATASANSATASATSASAAATSATSAAASATSAASSATSAAASWDSFDDRYLGPKSSAPTTDNDGNPLTNGVLYYNTGTGIMFVYNGNTSAWEQVAVSTSGFPTLSGNNTFTGQNILNAAGTTTIDLIVRATASQTANLQEWQNSSGTTLALIGAGGSFTFGPTFTSFLSAVNGRIEIQPNAATVVPITAKGFASQTANLQEWQNSGGTAIASIDANGRGTFTNLRSNTAASIFSVTSAASVVLTVQGAASQTANLQEWQTSAGTVIASVPASGIIAAQGINVNTNGAYLGRYFQVPAATGAYIDLSAVTGSLSVIGRTTTAPTLIVQSAASQTANLQEWRDSAGNVFSLVSGAGRLSVRTQSLTASLNVSTQSSGNIGAIIQGVASQTADLQQWQNTSGTVMAAVNAFGGAGFGGTGPSSSQSLRVFTNSNASVVGIVVQGSSGQTADLQQWQDSSGNVLAEINSSGSLLTSSIRDLADTGSFVTLNSLTNNGSVLINTRNAAAKGLVVQGAASQTANLQEWQNSGGTILARINSSGQYVGDGSQLTGISAGVSLETLEEVEQQVIMGALL